MKTTTLTLAAIATLTVGSFFAQDLHLNLNTFNPICTGDANGKVELLISGGALPYFVNGVEISGEMYTVENLTAGEYTLIVSDANEASSTINFNLVNPEPIHIMATIGHVTTYNGNDGRIDVTVDRPVAYYWTADSGTEVSSITAEDQINLRAGNYTLKVIDKNTGCRAIRHFGINQPNKPSFRSDYDPIRNDFSNPSAMNIYPNPSNGVVNLKAETEIKEAYVMNDFGIVVHRCENNTLGSTETIQLNPGSYTLVTTDKLGTQFAERIIVR